MTRTNFVKSLIQSDIRALSTDNMLVAGLVFFHGIFVTLQSQTCIINHHNNNSFGTFDSHSYFSRRRPLPVENFGSRQLFFGIRPYTLSREGGSGIFHGAVPSASASAGRCARRHAKGAAQDIHRILCGRCHAHQGA